MEKFQTGEASGSARFAGVLFPVFSMRWSGDQGIGDTSGVKLALELCRDFGLNLLQILPITHTGEDHSPYSGVSSMALEPSYIDVSILSELRDGEIDKVVKSLGRDPRKEALVDYNLVKKLKLNCIYRAFERSRVARGDCPEFDAFCAENKNWLEGLVSWQVGVWEERVTSGADVATEPWLAMVGACGGQGSDCESRRNSAALFISWVQWLAHTQWLAVKVHAEYCGVKLMGDLPLGVAEHSVDVLHEPELFEPGWYMGAPGESHRPQGTFMQRWGQNWGIPSFDYAQQEMTGYAWWRRRVHAMGHFFHIVRLDHIAGYFRVYGFPWHPRDNERVMKMTDDERREFTGSQLPKFLPNGDDTELGAAKNLRRGELLLMALVDECPQVQWVAEDLGWVPHYVRPLLQRMGIATMSVLDKPHSDIPEGSLVCFGIHDHPPVRTQWGEYQRLSRSESFEEVRRGQHGLVHLAQLLSDAVFDSLRSEILNHLVHGTEVRDADEEMEWGWIRALMMTPASLAVLQIQEVLGSTEQINRPGESEENWRYRVSFDLDNVPEPVIERLGRLQQVVVESGRGGESAYFEDQQVGY